MGIYWKVFALNKRQSLLQHSFLKFIEILMNNAAEPLVDILKVPELRMYTVNNAAVAIARARGMDSNLIALPQELIDLIISYVTADEDLINLGLASSFFFRLLAPVLTKAVAKTEAPWAGQRIITASDWGCGIPSCVPKETIRRIASEGMSKEEWSPGQNAEAKRSYYLYNMKALEITDCIGVSDCRCGARLHQPTNQIRRLAHLRMSADDVALLGRLTCPPAPHAPYQAVLRCVDLKEFVRDDVIASSEYPYSLGEVLCCFTAWSDGGHARWAGRRCDITSLQHVEDSWKDVSEEAVSHLEDEGKDWRVTGGKRA
ncbi:hypothetical protein LTR97_002585 [Elasticomyces elasticus]|uniref:F-box domain-containing protein n=1 Tax=Elasticomyces elasticus TaxID=574655 RepID=A0AAN7WHB5_9PEZI|nr:hypothetical protein LTR97_002585 [Elasticomyces elasticus]